MGDGEREEKEGDGEKEGKEEEKEEWGGGGWKRIRWGKEGEEVEGIGQEKRRKG